MQRALAIHRTPLPSLPFPRSCFIMLDHSLSCFSNFPSLRTVRQPTNYPHCWQDQGQRILSALPAEATSGERVSVTFLDRKGLLKHYTRLYMAFSVDRLLPQSGEGL